MNHLIGNALICLARSQFRLVRVALAFLACVAMAFNAAAQGPDPRDIFAPLTFPDPAGPTRSVSGIPGPAYWQNRADYTIVARIDPATHILTGHETITYVNNSPDPLDILWLQLDQNIYRADARAAVSRRCCHYTDGDRLDKIEVETDGQSVVPAFIVSDTRLRISLREALAPHGGTVRVQDRLSLHHPRFMGRPYSSNTKQQGRHFRNCPVVPAHGGLRRPARLGHAAISWI